MTDCANDDFAICYLPRFGTVLGYGVVHVVLLAGQAAAAAGMPRQAAVEWGRALWHEHVACSWLAFLRGATRCLLTPEHACHAAYAGVDARSWSF